ncbi:hypothetical protein NDI85_06125 [Halomicroarcula sp. S1AR25-4]|uniref:hypothetical protein n=1 Tax=Haloarcula sp. S1AR25-4 TaxID=2950538 RepID=UPI00287652BA|nr:hypothetical protein [Halomicroarcula sp. S1AR25-4]MDS0277363.1 hypothetical protein [Halomicroarcula sp. S1AR25-4]
MATIIHEKIEGHGPYAYRVTYSDGQHHWEYLGKVDDSSEDDGEWGHELSPARVHEASTTLIVGW